MCLCPFTDLNLCTRDYRLPWKSFALAAFIQLFFFLKGSDLRQWCCSYVTCRALAVLKLPSCPNLACGGVPMAGTLGEPLGGLRTGPALGTASWQLRVKLGSAHFQQQLSRALRQIYFHLSLWYSIFCLREFIQTKIWLFFVPLLPLPSLTNFTTRLWTSSHFLRGVMVPVSNSAFYSQTTWACINIFPLRCDSAHKIR